LAPAAFLNPHPGLPVTRRKSERNATGRFADPRRSAKGPGAVVAGDYYDMRPLVPFLLLVILGVVPACGGTSSGADGGVVGSGLKCGNGTLETDEICEGFDLRGRTCFSEGYLLGELRCSSICALDVSNCSKCGDGKISGIELCEPATSTRSGVFGAKTCASEVDAGATGDLDCSDTCDRLITAGCEFPPVPPGRNETCSISIGCAPGLVCDLVNSSPLTFKCQKHCASTSIGTATGCLAGELCSDGGIEIEGATMSPPNYAYCPPSSCGAGFSCADAGFAGLCTKPVGICR
jgi:hypothetical protein